MVLTEGDKAKELVGDEGRGTWEIGKCLSI
jgi:hypothetical protein